MYYEINVSLHGNHFFATDKRSITFLEQLHAVHRVFKKKFPESEGFQLSITRYQLTGESMDLSKSQPKGGI